MLQKIILLLLISAGAFAQSPNDKYLKKVAGLSKYPNVYVVIPILPKDNKHYLYYVSVGNKDLNNYYLKSPAIKSFPKYEDYLRAIIGKKITFDIKKAGVLNYTSIPKDISIYAEYNLHGIGFILKRYLNNKAGNLRNNALDNDMLLGLIQIMFNNNYLIAFDDYSGFYNFIKV